MGTFNLSSWALANRALVMFAVIVTLLVGFSAYRQLSQSEDPPFTFRAMVVRTLYPGATAEQVEEQVTDRIEKKLQELDALEFLRSYSKPGESMIFVFIKDGTPAPKIKDSWYQVRKKIGDIRGTLPAGTIGPFFNDEFGDTYGILYALQGEGYDYAQLKRWAERVRLDLLRVPDVAKVDLLGLQDEKIYVELSNTRLAALGLDLREVIRVLQEQNVMGPAGVFETPSDRIRVRVTGDYDSVEAIRMLPLRAGDKSFRLGDIATVNRGYIDPPAPKVRVGGSEAVVLAVSMESGGDILRLGEALQTETARVVQDLPLGLTLTQIADQPGSVRDSVGEFVRVLAEAVIIVLAVSFFSLGLKPGIVVALSIPLVLAATFACMHWLGIGLHKISLGALVLALGLLVDDAIIAVEMMQVKLEQGYDRLKAAAHAYSSTAFPMLTGTLITVAGFLPIGTAQSGVGEYTRSIFQVTAIALVLSWFVAVIVVPWLGYRLLPAPKPGAHHGDDAVYQTPFYLRFRRLVAGAVEQRWWVIAATLALFVAAIAAFPSVRKQFFPDSTRLELLVNLRLSDGASMQATEALVRRFEAEVQEDPAIAIMTSWVGSGAARFYLPMDQKLTESNFAEIVLTTRSIEDREALRQRLIQLLPERFPEANGRLFRLENGPPVGFPVQFRVSGFDKTTVRQLAAQVAEVMRGHPDLVNVQFDWDEPSRILRVDVDEERARVAGLTLQELRLFINNSLNGNVLTQYREKDQLIDVVMRGPGEERASLSQLESLAIPTASGRFVPLSQIAKVEAAFEPGTIFRRDRLPTITVRADIYSGAQAPDVSAAVYRDLKDFKATLPPGYLIAVGGATEESAKGQNSVVRGVPLALLLMLALLMIQLKSFSRTAIVLATAPLAIIGVAGALLLFDRPFGFVAMLGSIALSGMIMRNSVILVDQIEQDRSHGVALREAIIEATVRRFRPIVLTALAAILAMIPLMRSTFFGPMAVAIMGGLLVATVLTLVFLPALYAAAFERRAQKA